MEVVRLGTPIRFPCKSQGYQDLPKNHTSGRHEISDMGYYPTVPWRADFLLIASTVLVHPLGALDSRHAFPSRPISNRKSFTGARDVIALGNPFNMAEASGGKSKSSAKMASHDDSSDSEHETETTKSFHRRMSTNKEIKSTLGATFLPQIHLKEKLE